MATKKVSGVSRNASKRGGEKNVTAKSVDKVTKKDRAARIKLLVERATTAKVRQAVRGNSRKKPVNQVVTVGLIYAEGAYDAE